MPWQVPGFRPRADLASGTGRVVLATGESAGELVVIKYLNVGSSRTSDDLRSVISDIDQLPDDYFVRIRELVQGNGHNAIVMDPVNGTTMRALIRDDGAFEPESALIVFRDILTGLAYAHALNIVHGDLSPENVMINADGRPVMLNVGAATWDPREPALSSGVYLSPQRWSGGPPTAAADVYAATVGFVESLTGEPPYWEDIDLERLRRRHESEDIDVGGVPAALHDVVRAGMAKSAGSRMAATALLDLVETAAVAGYGRDWQDRGRDGLIRRVRSGSLPLDGARAADGGDDVRDTEDVASDDYYADVSSADGNGDAAPVESPSVPTPDAAEPASRDADAVVAAAADIVAFARLRDAAETDAILAASVDEDLTEEEEGAVAEIERLLFLEPSSAQGDQASSTDATTVGAGDADTATTGATDPDRGLSDADRGRSDAGSERETAPALSAGVTTRTGGRHRGWLVAGTVAAVLVVAGLLAWAGVGLTGSGTHPAAAASSRPVGTALSPTPAPSVSVPASAGMPPIGGTPTGTATLPPATTSPTGTASPSEPSTGVAGTSSAAPTLPLTGFEHPIRLMAATAAAFILAGALLLYAGRQRDVGARQRRNLRARRRRNPGAGRRRDEVPAGRQLRARTPASG